MQTHVLIVEDDTALNQMLGLHFDDQGCVVHRVENCDAALAAIKTETIDVVLLDQQLPDGLGIELLPELFDAAPSISVIMMTGQHDLELAIRAIKGGAADFIHKPLKTDVLQATFDKVMSARRARSDQARMPTPASGDLIGRSEAMVEVSKQIALCATNSASVLISGESGTGKEVVARLIHQYSGCNGPFVAINCAAIVDSLLESELFGHEKGAFTGADRTNPGRFEQAANGTLFLDEVAELAPALQAKLLRALQERVIERVGGRTSIKVTARIIAATHRDLFARARDGQFREDLAYRLNVLEIRLPALRERKEDIPLLAAALLGRNAAANEQVTPTLSPRALERLQAYDWPGNVRELNNVLTQAAVTARDGHIDETHLRFRDLVEPVAKAVDVGSTKLGTLDEIEAAHIQRVLEHTGGHKGQSCEILGISRPALDRKIQKYRLDIPGKG